ncbi:MAG TPA: hypothetical protein VGL20_07795, partial [Candidatus Dormibacteraeota bacterium]
SDAATDTITVTLTSGASASATHAGLSSAGGTVGVTGVNATALTDASVAVSATATDLAGNVSAAATATTTKDTVAPAAPTAVAISNGGGTGSAYINIANKGSVNYGVTIPANAGNATTDTVAVSLTSGTVVSGTVAGPGAAGGSVTVGALNATGLTDGPVAVSATSTDLAGNVSTAKTGTTTKDTVAPTLVTAVSVQGSGGTSGKMESGDALNLTFSEALAPTSVPGTTTVTESRTGGVLGGGGSSTLSMNGVIQSSPISIDNSYLNLGLLGTSVQGTATGAITLTNSNTTVSILLGTVTPSGGGIGGGLAAGSAAVTVSPVAAITDLAGNPAVTTSTATVTRLF